MENTKDFDLEILTVLASGHKKLMEEIALGLENKKFSNNKILYEYINNYYLTNNLNKAFPIGISVNNIIAHDSYHPNHLVEFKKGDFIKVDFGMEQSGNIIDSARTFEFNTKVDLYHKSITDCKQIVNNIEEYIKKELEKNKKILIQKISVFTNLQIEMFGYNALDFLGGHTIEKGRVHGKKLILNKPLTKLPPECASHIDGNAELTEGEMFAIEVYIPNVKSLGRMVQNVKIPITHFEIDYDFKINLLNSKEKIIFDKLKVQTNNLPHDYTVHELFDKKVIKNLLNKDAIVKHYPLEWIDNTENIKYVQYEDCFYIKNNTLLNITGK
jgi:methionine aminopeptidase